MKEQTTTEQLFQDLHIERRWLRGQPFGRDANGNEIRQINGKLIRSAVELMLESVGRKVVDDVGQGLPWLSSLPEAGRDQQVSVAQDAAFDLLVTLLNAVIRDKRFHVSREYLMNEGHNYSYEFEFFVNYFAQAICGDPDFFFHRGTRSFPTSLLWIARPFTLQQVYNLVPRFTAKFVDTDIRVLRTTRNSAVIQWWGQAQAEKVPEPSRSGYLEMGCRAYLGAYATIPSLLYPHLPPAQVKETTCQVQGDECCTWEFVWQNPRPRRIRWLWLGVAGTAVLGAYSLSALPGVAWLKLVAAWLALLPLVAGWLVPRLRRIEYENELKAQQLLEQRAAAETQYDQLQTAYGDLQIANVGLQTKVSELTTLHDVSLVLNSTLKQEELLAWTLHIVTTNLNFDRAMVLQVDEERRVVTGGQMIGGTPEMDELVARLELSLDDDKMLLARVVKTSEPVLVRDASQIGGDATRSIIAALKTQAFLAVPFQAKGRCVGVLIVDNLHSMRPITEDDQNLLVTLGYAVGMAIENARLYEAIEEYSRTLEKRVALRTRDLAEEKSKLDAILRNIADGLLVTSPGGEVLIVNPAFEELFGRPAIGLVGRSLTQEVMEEELGLLIANALRSQESTFMADIPLPNGRVLMASSAAIQENGRTLGVVTVLRDVTHEKEVDRMKTDFISMVSHELRTPLTSVLGFAKLISKTFAQDVVAKIPTGDRRGQRAVRRISDNLDIIVGEGERLTRLINDVLDIAKIEAGKMVWQFESVGVEDVVHRAITAMSSLAAAKDLAVEVEMEKGLPPVWADRDRLVQVMTNLLSNAIKFTDQGWIRVRGHRLWVADGQWQGEADLNLPAYQPANLLAHPSIPPTDWLMVSVQDTGIGIAEEHLPEIFEKFRQVGDVLTDRPKGTGLGLSICKEIVDHHGGRIWAVSEVGKGSTFTFVLPLTAEVTPRPPVVGEIRRRVIQAFRSDLGLGEKDGQLILVVDDDASIRKLLHQELTEVGYRVIEAADGAEALSKAREEQPALIVLDVMMPGISGFDVTSVLKADPATADIPILILSILEDQEKGFRLGADEYLTKPLDADELLQAIATLLSRAERGEGRKKVLIVDQDVSVLETITGILRERGYRVVKAYDGQEGVEKAKRERPDVIILDAMISEMNDYEVLRALKYEAETSDVRVIVLMTEISPHETIET